eukprot:Amastigsp_a842321_14.p5 type:complete len:107 gc:universal Amastigsp_a842321_14:494-814(+)
MSWCHMLTRSTSAMASENNAVLRSNAEWSSPRSFESVPSTSSTSTAGAVARASRPSQSPRVVCCRPRCSSMTSNCVWNSLLRSVDLPDDCAPSTATTRNGVLLCAS